jgi:hypothetical protein
MKEMGAICTALGLIPEAKAWYKVAIARDPLDAVSQQALYRLEEKSRSENAPEGPSPVAPRTP